jgi:hypothetical protein
MIPIRWESGFLAITGYASGGRNDPGAPGFDVTSLVFPAYMKALRVANACRRLPSSGMPDWARKCSAGQRKSSRTHGWRAARIAGRPPSFGGIRQRESILRPALLRDVSVQRGFTRQMFNGNAGGHQSRRCCWASIRRPNAGSLGTSLRLRSDALRRSTLRTTGARRRLTLNLGLRDGDRPLTERFDCTSGSISRRASIDRAGLQPA